TGDPHRVPRRAEARGVGGGGHSTAPGRLLPQGGRGRYRGKSSGPCRRRCPRGRQRDGRDPPHRGAQTPAHATPADSDGAVQRAANGRRSERAMSDGTIGALQTLELEPLPLEAAEQLVAVRVAKGGARITDVPVPRIVQTGNGNPLALELLT